jgi:hypothetical protein
VLSRGRPCRVSKLPTLGAVADAGVHPLAPTLPPLPPVRSPPCFAAAARPACSAALSPVLGFAGSPGAVFVLKRRFHRVPSQACTVTVVLPRHAAGLGIEIGTEQGPSIHGVSVCARAHVRRRTAHRLVGDPLCLSGVEVGGAGREKGRAACHAVVKAVRGRHGGCVCVVATGDWRSFCRQDDVCRSWFPGGAGWRPAARGPIRRALAV